MIFEGGFVGLFLFGVVDTVIFYDDIKLVLLFFADQQGRIGRGQFAHS